MAAGDSGGLPGRVQLRLVGAFAVSCDSTPVTGAELGSRKARLLLKLLAVERAHTVQVERIAEVLWGDAPPAGWAANIAALVSRLRRALGADVIHGGRSGYRLGPGPTVQVDLDDAGRWADEAERRLAAAEPALALAAATRARDVLTTGLVLEDEPAAEWAHPAWNEHSELTKRVRRSLAEAALATGEAALAVMVAAEAVSEDIYDERARRMLMRAYVACGEPARALATYAELRDVLESELGADPAAQTRSLHLAVLREQEQVGYGEPASAVRGSPVGELGLADQPGVPRLPGQSGVPRLPGESGVPRLSGRSGELDLAGRAVELGRLRAAWNDAAAGRPALYLVCGEAGIGKTRLVAELIEIAAATGGTALIARCYETERSLFLQPFVDAIATAIRTIPSARLRELTREHAPALMRLVPEAAALLGPLPATRPEAADIERRRAFEAVTAFIRALAARGPVLINLDDLQNAGRATVELLHYLARHVSGSRLLVVATVRAEEGAEIIDSLADVSAVVQLGPLSPDAVAILAATAGQAGQIESIVGRTRGHTLFVVETLRALAVGNTGVPDSLEAAVLARVRRAGHAVELALRAGAVLGASFDPVTVAGLLGQSSQAAIATCADAYAARLLVVAGRDYEFANDLIREVLYATTPAPARLAYHSLAADLLTSKPEAMAAHASAARNWRRAARGWLLAGEEALARAAAADAAELLTRSIDAAGRAGDHEVRARALLARGTARETRAEYGAALSDIEAAVTSAQETGDRRMEMIGLIALGGDVHAALGQPIPDAIKTVERGLSIATALSDRAAEANLRARLVIYAVNGLRFDDAVEQGRLAVRAARASGDEEALAAALDGQKASVAYIGEIDALIPVIEELEPLVRRLGDLRRLNWTLFESAFPALAGGDWPAAVTRIDAALEVSRRSGSMSHATWHVATLGAVARLRGRYDEAIGIGNQAVALAEKAPHAWAVAVAGAELGTTLLEAGALEEAIAVLERARVAASQTGVEAILLRCLAPLAEATGSPEVLAEAAALLEGISAPDGSAFLTADGCYLAVARAWLSRGEPELARAVLVPLLAAASRVPWVAVLAGASLVDGQAALSLGLASEAVSALRRAAELGRRHGLPRVAHEAADALSLCPLIAASCIAVSCIAESCNETAKPGAKIARGRTTRPGPREAHMAIDESKLNELLGRFVSDLGATAAAGNIVVGHRLGLFRALAEGPATAQELAARTETNQRYVAEWLRGQAAGGYLQHDAATDTYSMTEEQAFALTNPDGGIYIPGAFVLALGTLKANDRITAAFKSGDGMGWHEHDEDVFVGCEQFFRPGYIANLVPSWLPALDGVVDKLRSGAKGADLGCGLGASTVLLGQAYPESRFVGSDYHERSVELARKRAADAGVGDRVQFEVAPAAGFSGSGYDLVTTFDCLHDMGDPLSAAKHIRRALADDGTWMVVEPAAADDVAGNLNPVGRVYYNFSTQLCIPNALSQQGGYALGAQAGEAAIRRIATDAGFTRFRRATETPFNIVYEVRP